MANSAWADMPMMMWEVVVILLAPVAIWIWDAWEGRRRRERQKRWREEHGRQDQPPPQDVEPD